jgi:probable F420-dependent oxidoreductase
MQIGVQLPQIGDDTGPDALRRVASHAEEVGLDSLWVSDHIAFPAGESSPYPYSADGSFPVPFDAPWMEAITTMAFIAGFTERVGIGVSVLVTPLRRTLVLAKQLATLTALAAGPLMVGVGAGWLREEFELLQVDFTTRGAQLDEQLDALQSVWTAEQATHAGDHVRFDPLIMAPRPHPRPQIWVGGTSGAALRRAGRRGDAWHAVGVMEPAALAAAQQQVADAAAAAGRDPADIALTVRIGSRPGARGLASLQRRLEPFRHAGCAHAVVDPVVSSVQELLDFVEDLAGLDR